MNLVVTNVPGPREILYLDGARLIEMNGAPPVMDGLGMVVAASSYDNALRVAVAACRQVMPEPERMREYLQQSFAELGQAYASPAPRRATAPTARRSARKKTAAKI